MIDLNSIVQSAQGGQAVDNLAARFGLSPQQVQSALNALLPAVEMGLKNAGGSGAAGTILSHLGDPAHQQSYADPNGAGGAGAASAGPVLGGLFGGHDRVGPVADQVSAESGIPAAVIRAMLPAVVSIVMGGLGRAAAGGGLGGALSGLLRSAFGGGETGGGHPPASSQGEGGGLGGVLGGVLGGLFGGAGQPVPRDGEPAGSPPATDQDNTPAAGTGAASGGILDELSRMVTAGTPASDDHRDRLAGIMGG